MAATEIAKDTIPRTNAGYNLTDSADWNTMSTGAGNGVKWTAEPGTDLIALKNDTGGPATFTFKINQPSGYSTFGVTISDVTLAVADGKTYFVRLSSLFKDANGVITVECNVAGKIIVFDLG